MGKRKERRLAAQMASSRRVKLDLAVEPSGDLVGTSRQDEVGGDLDQNPHARAPNSPSSPGEGQENPLLLLGQYSDDELEEEKRITEPSVVEGSSVDHNEKVEECMDGKGEKDGYEDKLASPEYEEKNAADGNLEPVNAVKKFERHIGESALTAPNKKYGEVDSMSGVCVSGMSGMQTDQDATSEWKIVMHEESNKYYYWNTMTGETSWEVPDVLVRGMEMASGQKLFPIVEGGSTPLDAHSSGTNLNVELDVYPNASVLGGHMSVNSINSAKEHLGSGIEMETGNIESKDIDDPILDENHNAVNMTYKEASVPNDSFSAQQSSMILSGLGGSATTGNEHPITINGKEKNGQPIVADDCAEASIDHFAQLLKFGENLLQRLEVLEGSGNQTQAYDWRLKFILEIKIRLSDCKALAYYGSTLLPFWWHTDTCFKQLEAAIVEKTSQSARQEYSNEEEMLQITSCKDNDTSCQIMGIETGVGAEDNELPSSTVENIYASTSIVDTSKVVQNGSLSSGSSGSELGEIEPGEIREEVNEYPVPVRLIPKIEFHAGDDADMDVDMEVDNENPTDHITSMDALSSKGFAQPEQPTYLNTDLSLVESTPSEPVEEFNAPPPPDEEWIPPPPPDTEPVPPPPPDESPAHFYPTTPYAEAMPPVPYTGQYNFTYPASTYGYYVPSITDTTNTTYYAPAGSCENSEIQAPPYHQPAANVLPEAIPAAVNPVEAVVYYGLQNGAAPPGPEISSLESCTFYSEPVSYDNVASGHMGSVAVAPDSGYAPMPSLKVESSATISENDVNLKVASTLASAETAGAAAINENTMAAATTADAKNPPKIVRSKKRTVAVAPTLRSNKKVSSLVDKWKAAKEELHGDEDDEPENAYEMLEKKKQREIEEWRAQQIASGEARENANFQPLGGDWRERVKRKRAKSSSDTKHAPTKVTTSEQQQPNLMELSKDLPSGWQAYWDESSKQVYYGHSITSETTWTRPSR